MMVLAEARLRVADARRRSIHRGKLGRAILHRRDINPALFIVNASAGRWDVGAGDFSPANAAVHHRFCLAKQRLGVRVACATRRRWADGQPFWLERP